MNGLPYYKKYPRDFIEGTIQLPFELKVTYGFILDLIYMQGGELPDDARYISGLLGVSVRKWKSLRNGLIQAGKIQAVTTAEGGYLTNYRAVSELETTAKLTRKQAENRSRPNKNNGLQTPKHHHTESDTDKKRKPTVSQKKGSRLPDGWVLPKAWGEWAVDLGLTPDVVRNEADKFRDYWHSLTGRTATKLDWFATWRNWCRKAQADQQRYSQRKGDTNGRLAEIHGWFANGGMDSDPGSVVARSELPDDGRSRATDDPDGLGVGPFEVPEAYSRTGIYRSSPGVSVSAEACGDHQPSFLTVIDGTGGRW